MIRIVLKQKEPDHWIDPSSLVKIPGVGKKTAERLVVELKDRLAKLTLTQPNEALTLPVVSATDGSTIIPINDTREEALSALVALGYKAPVASKIIQSVYNKLADLSLEASP